MRGSEIADVAETVQEVVPAPGSPGGPTPAAGWKGRARTVFSFPAMLGAILAGIVVAFVGSGVSDPDIWWHLRNAEYLLTQHKFIRVDMYSFTLSGYPWVNPEWLGEIPFYLGWRAWGLVGIKVVTILAAEAIIFGLLYLSYQRSGNIKASALACYFAVFLAVVNFGPRTILFGYCCLLALLIVLERFRSRGKAPLWVLPPLFCLWANTHGSWLIGLVVFGIIVAGGLIGGSWGRVEAVRWTPRQLRNLLLAMGASIAALFANPYGSKLILWSVEYPFKLKLAVNHVQEWQSVNFHDPRGKVAIVLIVVLLLGSLLSRHRWQLTELGLVLFGLYSGLAYERFLFLAAVLITPLLAKFLDVVPPYRREIDKPILNALIVAAVLAFIIHGFPSNARLEESVDKEYPAEVLPYLKSHPPAGPVLNHYNWGGYLGWEDRNFKDFIDPRADIFVVYGSMFKDYIDLIGLKDPAAVLDKYSIRYVLFPPDQPLVYVLRHDPRWRTVFEGKISVLFERVGPMPAVPRG